MTMIIHKDGVKDCVYRGEDAQEPGTVKEELLALILSIKALTAEIDKMKEKPTIPPNRGKAR